jgi:hypothetical protein
VEDTAFPDFWKKTVKKRETEQVWNLKPNGNQTYRC